MRKIRYHFIKHYLSSWALMANVSAGKAAKESDVASVVKLLEPKGVALERFGSSGDGGYLMPNDLEGVTACFSPGVAQEASFEQEMLQRGIPCFCIDGSVRESPISDPHLEFERLFLAAGDSPGHVSLDTWVAERAPAGDLVLQIDIEGSEWPAILAASESTLSRFRLILLELHEFEKVFDAFGVRIIGAVLQKLRRNFDVVHVHPNNCSGEISHAGVTIPRVLELTLVRKDRMAFVTRSPLQVPHPLDRPNAPDYPDLTLDSLFSFARSSNVG